MKVMVAFPEKPKMAPSSRFSRLLWLYVGLLRITGFYPCSPLLHPSSPSRPTISIPWMLTTVTLALISSLGVLFQIWIAYLYDFFPLENMDFFSLIRFTFLVSIYLQVPLTYAFMGIRSRQIKHLVSRSVQVLSRLFTSAAEKRLTWVLVTIGVYGLICSVGDLYGTYYASSTMFLSPNATFTPTTPFPIVIQSEHATMGILAGVLCSLYPLICYTGMAAPFFVSFLVLAIGEGFIQVRRDLQCIEKCNSPTKEKGLEITEVLWNFRELSGLLDELNKIFGFLILLNCCIELGSVMSLMASALRLSLAQESMEPNDVFEVRKAADGFIAIFLNAYSCFIIFNGCVRIAVFVRNHDEVGRLRSYLHMLMLSHKSSPLTELYDQFRNEISSESGAVSACGFVFITREYVAMVFGAALTFIILVYQTRDSKLDMRTFLETAQFHKDFCYLCNSSQSPGPQMPAIN